MCTCSSCEFPGMVGGLRADVKHGVNAGHNVGHVAHVSAARRLRPRRFVVREHDPERLRVARVQLPQRVVRQHVLIRSRVPRQFDLHMRAKH